MSPTRGFTVQPDLSPSPPRARASVGSTWGWVREAGLGEEGESGAQLRVRRAGAPGPCMDMYTPIVGPNSMHPL